MARLLYDAKPTDPTSVEKMGWMAHFPFDWSKEERTSSAIGWAKAPADARVEHQLREFDSDDPDADPISVWAVRVTWYRPTTMAALRNLLTTAREVAATYDLDEHEGQCLESAVEWIGYALGEPAELPDPIELTSEKTPKFKFLGGSGIVNLPMYDLDASGSTCMSFWAYKLTRNDKTAWCQNCTQVETRWVHGFGADRYEWLRFLYPCKMSS